MLLSYIEQLRNQPASVRKRFAVVFATIVTVLVVLVYLLTLYLNSLGTRSLEPKETDTSELRENNNTAKTQFDSSNEFLETPSERLFDTKQNTPPQKDFSQSTKSIQQSFNEIQLDEAVHTATDTATTTQ
jgi:hypothetical protein